MTFTYQEKLVDSLLNTGAFSLTQKRQLLELKEQPLNMIERFVLGGKYIDEETLAKMKAQACGLPYTDLHSCVIETSVFALIPKDVCENFQIIAFKKTDETLFVGMVHADNYAALDSLDILGKKFGLDIEVSVVSLVGFQSACARASLPRQGHESHSIEQKTQLHAQPFQNLSSPDELASTLRQAPISKIVNDIFSRALELSASDIHIEPHANNVRVRARVDGALQTILTLPLYLSSALIARVKSITNLNPTLHTKSQKGRAFFAVNGKLMTFFASSMPLLGAEKIVVSILSPNSKMPSLESLGFHSELRRKLSLAIAQRQGLFLVTGNAHSGKTTTLYSILNTLNREEFNVVSLEDTVEHTISGVNQIEHSFEQEDEALSLLHTLLQQDIDVCMFSEIVNARTLSPLLSAALSGKLILSSLYATSVEDAVKRLFGFGADRFLLSSGLRVVINQRLLRKNCQHCLVEDTISPAQQRKFAAMIAALPQSYRTSVDKPRFFKTKGCLGCQMTGYQGRVLIAEMLVCDEGMRKSLSTGMSAKKCLDLFSQQQCLTLVQDALLNVYCGKISAAEYETVEK